MKYYALGYATRSCAGTRAVLALVTIAAFAVLIVTPFAVEDGGGDFELSHRIGTQWREDAKAQRHSACHCVVASSRLCVAILLTSSGIAALQALLPGVNVHVMNRPEKN